MAKSLAHLRNQHPCPSNRTLVITWNAVSRLNLNYFNIHLFIYAKEEYYFISHEYKCLSLRAIEKRKAREFMDAFIFKFNNIKRRVTTFTSMSLYLPCPLNRRLGAPQVWSGHFDEEEILCHACKLKPVFSSPQRSRLYPTELCHPHLYCTNT